MDLIEQCRLACDELIEVTGRAALEAVLQLSSQRVTGGPPHPGQRRAGEVVWHGQQPGSVMLSDRKLAVRRPRLRKRGVGEHRGGDTRLYSCAGRAAVEGTHAGDSDARRVDSKLRAVIPEMADAVGVSRSSVSRQMQEASETELKELLERRFDQLELLIIYLDGLQFGDHLLIGAVGVDEKDHKHVLAIREGATKNATVAKELLEDLVARGVNPEQKRLFRDRRLEGFASGNQRRVRQPSSGAEVSRA